MEGEPAAAPEGAKIEFVEDLWVQCDEASCRKWRRLPPGSVVDDHMRWYCRMNPDQRYNSCDIDEELYDERKEILLTTTAPTESDSKSRSKAKRRKRDDSTERVSSLQAELQKRRTWCETKMKNDGTDLKDWSPEDIRLLTTHAPEATRLVMQSTDLCSALEYFADEKRLELLQVSRTALKASLQMALKKMMADVDAMLQEVSILA